MTRSDVSKMQDATSPPLERPRYLFVASAAISRSAIERHFVELDSAVTAEDIVVADNNTMLMESVRSRWPQAKTVLAPKSRGSSIKLLQSVQRLIFFWDGEDLTTLLFEARVASMPTKLISIPVTRVVNKKLTNNFDVYIGRGSPWGNPFAISHSEDGPDRAEVIEKYREYFYEKIQGDSSFKKGILALRGSRLACFCKPQACHGDVIAEYLDNQEDID